MANVELCFLGDRYLIPSELREYVGYLQEFEKIHEEVMVLLTSQMSQGKYTGGADEDFIYFKTPLIKVGERIITRLSDKGIFDVTLNDLVYKNKGYILLHDVCKDTMQCMVNILLNAMDDWANGYETAYNTASSSITGSGVSIWTNSLSSALVYSAMEASTLKKQSDKASKEYSEAMSKLGKNVFGKKEKQERDVLVNKYYPGVANALSLFTSDLMETYITILGENGVFDCSKVEQYNLKRSSDLLNNIGLVADKKGILKRAFICCPYNPDVYKAVLDNSLSDVETFLTAQYFLQDEILLESLTQYCRNKKTDFESIVVPVKVIALYKQQSEKSIWLSLYNNQISSVKRKYAIMKHAISSTQNLRFWIKDNIVESAMVLCDMSEADISQAISASVNRKIISDNQFDAFVELGLLSIDEIAVSDIPVKSLEDVNSEYAKALLAAVKKLILELRTHIAMRIDEATKTKREYEDALREYNKEIDKLSREMSMLEEKRKALRFFAFGQKKEIDDQIRLVCETIDTYKNKNDPSIIKHTYEQLMQEADSII